MAQRSVGISIDQIQRVRCRDGDGDPAPTGQLDTIPVRTGIGIACHGTVIKRAVWPIHEGLRLLSCAKRENGTRILDRSDRPKRRAQLGHLGRNDRADLQLSVDMTADDIIDREVAGSHVEGPGPRIRFIPDIEDCCDERILP